MSHTAPTETVLVSTWGDGLFVVEAETRTHELAGQPVRGLAPDGRGGALAIVDGHTLRRRDAQGRWTLLATWSDAVLACCAAFGERIVVGTEDARVLLVEPDATIAPLDGFDTVEGRETWYAGTAVIDGKTVGPPLGVRSIAAASDASLVLANVHVGGIPRSTDGGLGWRPTIAVESDIHEVRVHPTQHRLVAAAGAVGLCTSQDAGATWEVRHAGLHSPYCSAVAFVGDDVLVSASEGPFAAAGALYRCSITQPGSVLARAQDGLPPWFSGIIDTGCVASEGSCAAAVDRGGSLYVSTDAGHRWQRRAEGLQGASSVLLVTGAR